MEAMIVLRLVHIGFGVFWAGGVLFMNLVVGPALADVGPDAMRVMQALHRRRYIDILLASALIAILSGLDLMRRDSGGFAPAWFHTPFGAGLATGMIAAIVAFAIGALFVRPAINRLIGLGTAAAEAAPDRRDGLLVELYAVRARLTAVGMVATLFLIIAVIAMATARYW